MPYCITKAKWEMWYTGIHYGMGNVLDDSKQYFDWYSADEYKSVIF